MRIRTLLPLTAAIILTGCMTTRSPEVFPGLANADQAPREQMCLLRESQHCYIGSVGDAVVTQYDVNPISLATYRQWYLPPGRHVLAIFYREQRNLETVVAGPRLVTLDAQPGQTYALRSRVNGADTWFDDTLSTASWRPAVVDEKTGHQVAITDINR